MKKITISYTLLMLISMISCKDFLSVIPDNKLTVPKTIEDFQKLLDNTMAMNFSPGPALGDLGSDDFYVTYSQWQSMSATARNSYVWNKEIYEGEPNTNWRDMYNAIYHANIVLEGLEEITPDKGERARYDHVKGSALFFRAFYHYYLEETFGEPYRPGSTEDDLGIPLRLNTDLEAKVRRSSVAEVYTQIERDLLDAKSLLSDHTDFQYPNRPSLAATFAFLSRMYLTIQDYQRSKDYADSCLKMYPVLMDYNVINIDARYPLRFDNSEVMFDAAAQQKQGVDIWTVDSTFFRAYNEYDLRRVAFFRDSEGRIAFKGSYSVTAIKGFTGFSTNEAYFNRAECKVRLGDIAGAMEDLNAVLEKRWKAGYFEPYNASSEEEALSLILNERRKELLFRGLRWIDLRRLNQHPSTAVTLHRTMNGKEYVLLPNSPRYTYPIPDEELSFNDLTQIER